MNSFIKLKKQRWEIISIVSVIVGVLAMCVIAWLTPGTPPVVCWSLTGAGFIPLFGAFRFYRKIKSVELESEAHAKELAALKVRIQEEREIFEQTKRALEQELEQRIGELEKKEREFRERLLTYHAWLEFPSLPSMDTDKDTSYAISDASELAQKDKEVRDLLDEQVKDLFENLINNRYSKNGTFQWEMLRAVLADLITSIAQIYIPDARQPLLETSIEDLLRAGNRMSLQILLTLDQLPLNLKTYNLQDVYEYVRQSTKAYKTFKAAEPYLTYARPLLYLGRMTMGTNPITLGVGWAAQEIIKKGAKSAITHYSNRYAMTLLHDFLGIIGTEAAGIYGGDYRHRDPNWIYGTELAHLISLFPHSQDTLRAGLKKIDVLQLRSEYDRLFLYRCIIAHQSANPERYSVNRQITYKETKIIARRLEDFFSDYLSGCNPKQADKWKKDAQKRLNIQLKLKFGDTPVTSRQKTEALEALACFLMYIKKQDIKALTENLADTEIYRSLPDAIRTQVLDRISEIHPGQIKIPDVGASAEILEAYVEDLIRLEVEHFPHDRRGLQTIEETADYFRQDFAKLRKRLDNAYVKLFTDMLVPESPSKKLHPWIIQGLLQYMDPIDPPCFFYKDVIIEEPSEEVLPIFQGAALMLVGTEHHLCLLAYKKKAPFDDMKILWHGGSDDQPAITMARIKGKFSDDVRLTGGVWNTKTSAHPAQPLGILVSGHPIIRYSSRFRCLIDFYERESSVFET